MSGKGNENVLIDAVDGIVESVIRKSLGKQLALEVVTELRDLQQTAGTQ